MLGLGPRCTGFNSLHPDPKKLDSLVFTWHDTQDMQKFGWILTFGLAAPVALISALLLLVILAPAPTITPVPAGQVLSATTKLYEPQSFPKTETNVSVISADARSLIVRNYLAKYDSPLTEYADLVVQISDKYELDYRLLVAIAQQESNLCKKIPDNSFNCWGFGIYGDLVTRFSSYPEGLETVAKTLKKNYIDKGLKTPEQIMVKYTPPSVEKGGPWAQGVNQFLSEME